MPPDASPPAAASGRTGVRRDTPRAGGADWFSGRPDEPRWARPALWALLAATAVLYLWNLSASGYANDYYAAAVKAGTESWKAWLFGSLDSGNSITVDKPPASLWVMVLSTRIFGFSLVRHAAAAGADGSRHGRHSVRRGASAGPARPPAWSPVRLLALTPVAALMFRFNNPDALLVLLLTAGRLLRDPGDRDPGGPERHCAGCCSPASRSVSPS